MLMYVPACGCSSLRLLQPAAVPACGGVVCLFFFVFRPANEPRGPQSCNSTASHTKYFRSPVRWMVSEYGPFLELAHICATFPMKLSSM